MMCRVFSLLSNQDRYPIIAIGQLYCGRLISPLRHVVKKLYEFILKIIDFISQFSLCLKRFCFAETRENETRILNAEDFKNCKDQQLVEFRTVLFSSDFQGNRVGKAKSLIHQMKNEGNLRILQLALYQYLRYAKEIHVGISKEDFLMLLELILSTGVNPTQIYFTEFIGHHGLFALSHISSPRFDKDVSEILAKAIEDRMDANLKNELLHLNKCKISESDKIKSIVPQGLAIELMRINSFLSLKDRNTLLRQTSKFDGCACYFKAATAQFLKDKRQMLRDLRELWRICFFRDRLQWREGDSRESFNDRSKCFDEDREKEFARFKVLVPKVKELINTLPPLYYRSQVEINDIQSFSLLNYMFEFVSKEEFCQLLVANGVDPLAHDGDILRNVCNHYTYWLDQGARGLADLYIDPLRILVNLSDPASPILKKFITDLKAKKPEIANRLLITE